MKNKKPESKVQLKAVSHLEEEYSRQRGRLNVIAEETGLSVEWLHKVRRGRIKEPSAEKLERVLRHGGFDVQVIKDND